MPSRSAKTRRMRDQKRYKANAEKYKEAVREAYSKNPEKKNEADRKAYKENPGKKKEAARKAYKENPEKKKEAAREAYKENPEKKKEAARETYKENPEKKKEAAREAYKENPEKKKEAAREAYEENPEKKKEAAREAYKESPEKKKEAAREAYKKNPENKKQAGRKVYTENPEKKKEAAKRAYNKNSDKKKASSKTAYRENREERKAAFTDYYHEHRDDICKDKRELYVLCPPNETTIKSYVNDLIGNLMRNPEIKLCLTMKLNKMFNSYTKTLTNKMKSKVACRLASSHLVHEILTIRKFNAGKFLKYVREVNSLCISDKSDFGDPSHSKHSEPYFYETAYKHAFQPTKLVVDRKKKCLAVAHLAPDPEEYINDEPMPLDMDGKAHISENGECSYLCRSVTDEDVQVILEVKEAFGKPVPKIREKLHGIDANCPHVHHVKTNKMDEDSDDMACIEQNKLGHPFPCSSSMCDSKLRILRSASVHYPALRKMLYSVYMAKKCHFTVAAIDDALSRSDYEALCKIANVQEYEELIGEHLNQGTDSSDLSADGLVNIETTLQVKYAEVFKNYRDKLNEDPAYACCSCERLLTKARVTKFTAKTDKYSSDQWCMLKAHLAERDDDFDNKTYYICTYCRPLLDDNKIPDRCVLNSLYVETVPDELSRLNALERQLIQRAKSFQTVIRLGTYTGKVPIYNATKAVKGTTFFLPLPLQDTITKLDTVDLPDDVSSEGALPDPELYIIIDGQPTKDKTVWQSLVDVDSIKKAVEKLNDINWLYQGVDEDSVDDAAKKAFDVVSGTTSCLIEKATAADIAELESYTIRRMDEKLPVGSDIDHYKMLKVHEPALDSRLKYLDVMCFPALFPTGRFGEFHPRQISLSFSEYVKSRLLNQDSRFRKSPEFVFYYLWQKELRELASGICNAMKRAGRHHVSVREFLTKVDSSDNETEANLSTILQSVRGSKQFWFLRKSELNCMIREHGPPTLFLTFSCAEYDSPDIAAYLHKVNDVPDNYPIGKLCAEDPISVSRKFSKKFHDFFLEVLLKGKVLGQVTDYFWKKEYQSRGAPHYHVLLWIEDAPVIGIDSDDKVLGWIQERITCRIPDEKTNPDLYRLVTRYQFHKCSDYCKRKVKVGGIFITRCKFGFPRPETENAKLNSIEDSLKSRNKIYDLARSYSETRVNDYNPVLLLLWRANIDIQFVSEDSLALAHYVTGYVTKAEKSHLLDLWEEVTGDQSLYSKLWSFGIRSLRSRECGMYEASDILLGDQLCRKSETVQWIPADLPHKRKRRLKNHKTLQEMLEKEPDSDNIFENNVIDVFYPTRPDQLEDVCLYDFVRWYVLSKVDCHGNRQYRKLNKPRLPNHKLYDPSKEDQREDYYYCLLLLFVPFRNESDLLGEGISAEEAFNRFISSTSCMGKHHEKLIKMLKAQTKVCKINEHREATEEVCTKHDDADEPEGVHIAGEAAAAMNDVRDMDMCDGDNFDLEERIALLNSDQRRVFENISGHLNHWWQHEQGLCHCSDLKPLHTFISGVGGTGKLFLIETIRKQVAEIWKDDDSGDTKCAVGAPTGMASYNVGGVTVHRLFSLPIEHGGKTAGYWPLSKPAQKIMRNNLRSLKLVIIDEVSMLSSLNLAYIHLRLEELFGGSDWFGSMNVVFVGDLLQLPPVNGLPVFSKLTNRAISGKLGCIGSVNIWRDTVTYDELTINERQKKDPTFSMILDEVRRGCPSKESIDCLRKRVITASVTDIYKQLCESGTYPVCLFPTCKACQDHNSIMLGALDSKLESFKCVDAIDETTGTCKWGKKAADALNKVNKDCNLTAGLMAELTVAVGARVMLRRNIDTKHGLVNGSIGTITAITSQCITVKFDHLVDPYPVERVKSKFMLMRSFYVYRKQFPLILAYAVTIHKCQGLSLNSAIIDLSNKVFSPGMAYVALSRVRSLEGLYLTDFDPSSIMVSNSSLEEINRLRSLYRKDLPLYEITGSGKKSTKRKFKVSVDDEAPSPKKPCRKEPPRKPHKRKATSSARNAKRAKVDDGTACVITNVHDAYQRTEWTDLRYCPTDEEWQRHTCELLGLRFRRTFECQDGGPDTILTRPDCRTLKKIMGDGNCLFRSLSYIITGSEDQHFALRTAIVQHMLLIPDMLIGLGADGQRNCLDVMCHPRRFESVEHYIRQTGMDLNGTWGTNVEMACLAHLIGSPVYCYDASQRHHIWAAYFPSDVDRSIHRDVRQKSLYIHFANHHFNVVSSIRVRSTRIPVA